MYPEVSTPDSHTAVRPKILVVDDEPDIVLTFKKGLEKHGFAVDGLNDPKEALAKFTPDVYDLLLLDINMPGLDGFELFEMLRTKDPDAKACFMTAYDIYFEKFKELYPNLELGYCVRKPVSIEELVLAIKTKILPSHTEPSGNVKV